MQIIEFSFESIEDLNWKLEPFKLNQINLLVGLSGVGKTKTLQAIYNLRKIIIEGRLTAGHWNVKFRLNDKEYIYKAVIKENEANKKIFTREELTQGKKKLLYRKGATVKLKNQVVPDLVASASLLYLFPKKKNIKPIFEAFDNIVFKRTSLYVSSKKRAEITPNLLEKFEEKKRLKQLNLNYINKRAKNKRVDWCLYIIERFYPDIFEQIKEVFLDIFSFVDTIGTQFLSDFPEYTNDSSYKPIMFIIEKNSNKKIPSFQLSGGMYRTLTHLTDIFTLPKNSVYLIDEIENSLGIIALPALIDALISNSNRLQLIMTTHHPRVINEMEMKYWRIVKRYNNIVQIKNASEIPELDSTSLLDKFVQLINSEIYENGITIGE